MVPSLTVGSRVYPQFRDGRERDCTTCLYDEACSIYGQCRLLVLAEVPPSSVTVTRAYVIVVHRISWRLKTF